MTASIYKQKNIRYEDGVSVFANIESETRLTDNDSNAWPKLNQSVIELIRKFAKPGDRVLAMGGCAMRLLEKMPDLDKHCVHTSLVDLKKAASQGMTTAMARLEDLPYQNETFDLIVCTDFLENVIDINPAIANILGVLKKGGHLLFSLPYKEDLKKYVGERNGASIHLRNFDESSLTLLFTRVFVCEVIQWDVVENFPKDEKELSGINPEEARGWHNKFLKKYFFSAYVKRFHKSFIHFVIKK